MGLRVWIGLHVHGTTCGGTMCGVGWHMDCAAMAVFVACHDMF